MSSLLKVAQINEISEPGSTMTGPSLPVHVLHGGYTTMPMAVLCSTVPYC